ncbi:MAG: DUF5702 domain-containing protein [Lachnospiraceae bacterium]
MLEQTKKGEITAFLSLIFILLLSFIGSILESASIQVSKNYVRTDTTRAMESVFAEYQKELLEAYDLFGLEATYETGNYREQNVLRRMEYYGAPTGDKQINKIQVLTDQGGKPCREQVYAYMSHKMGVNGIAEMLSTTTLWEEQESKSKEYQQEDIQTNKNLDTILIEKDTTLPKENNPLETISNLKKSNLLSVVMKKSDTISNKTISSTDLPSVRNKNQGYGTFTSTMEGGTSSKLYLGAYILEHFKHVVTPHEDGALSYEVEYIIGGKTCDKENLETVVKKLIAMRYVPNYAYLMTDTKKKAEAGVMAATLCSALALPAITEVAKQAILLAWAYGESIMDIRSLLAGHKIPLLKTTESWQLQLEELLQLGTQEDPKDGNDIEGGYTYAEYLRVLLFLEGEQKLTMRMLDVIERNIQVEYGASFFKVDQCISKVEVDSTCRLRRNIQYKFKTVYGYQ